MATSQHFWQESNLRHTASEAVALSTELQKHDGVLVTLACRHRQRASAHGLLPRLPHQRALLARRHPIRLR